VLKVIAIIGAVIAVIGALVAAFIYLWNTNEAFRDGVIAIWEGIKEAAMAIWGALQAFWEQWGETIITVFQAAWDQIVNIFTTVVTIITNIFKLFTAVLQGDWDGAWEAIKNIGKAAWDFIENSVKNLRTALGAIWDGILKYVKQIWENIRTAVTQKAQEVYTNTKSRLEQLWSYIKSIPSMALQWGRDIIQSLWDGIKQKWEDLKQGVADVGQSIKDFFNPWSKSSPSLIDNIRSGVAEIEKLYSNISLPDTQLSVASIGAGAAQGGTTKNVSINMAGLFSGANVNIGSEQDAKALARELYKLTASSARVQGVTI